MNEHLGISTIIPAYNEESNIKGCLEALLHQLRPKDEIIVVDNNSTDKTVEIARKLGVNVIHERQQGLSFARNAGFNAASNNIIARTDADSIVCNDWLNVIGSYFSTHDTKQAALTGPVYLREFLPIKIGVHQGLTKKALGHETLVGGNEALTKTLWQSIRTNLSNDDVQYAEDMEMSRVIEQHNSSVVFIPEMIVYTSARWMIRRPLRSARTWKRKMTNTKQLLGIK